MSTILIGVDDSPRSEDAIAFGGRLAGAASGRVIVACAFPYSDVPSRGANLDYRGALETEASRTARRMARELPAERVETVAVANPSPAHALQELAETSGAALVVVGSTHTGRAGRVVPGATAERLLHGAPCAVAVVPDGYAAHATAIRRIAVAYDGSETAKAAVAAAAGAARALDAELELIGVVSPEAYTAPVAAGGFGSLVAREDVEALLQAELDSVVAGLPYGVRAQGVRLTGDPAELLIARSEGVDLLVMGSRGYGPLRAVLMGGVSGRVVRAAHCPVIVVPRGVEAPLGELFGAAAASIR